MPLPPGADDPDPEEERARVPTGAAESLQARARDVFDADEPDASLGDSARPSEDSAGEDRNDGEYFPEPPRSPSPSSSPSLGSRSRGRQRHSPRAGPYASPSPPRRGRTTGRAGSTKAKDVWTFFQVAPDGVKRECAFCKQHHSANPRGKEPKPFAPSTSTGILRRHLYERHLEAWVQGCDQLKIDITAREALWAIYCAKSIFKIKMASSKFPFTSRQQYLINDPGPAKGVADFESGSAQDLQLDGRDIEREYLSSENVKLQNSFGRQVQSGSGAVRCLVKNLALQTITSWGECCPGRKNHPATTVRCMEADQYYISRHDGTELLTKTEPASRRIQHALNGQCNLTYMKLSFRKLQQLEVVAVEVAPCRSCRQTKVVAKSLPHVEAYRGKQNRSNSGSTADSAKKQPPFSNEAFVDAIVEWIVSDDQSINVIENEKLRNIFLMLRSELKDSDIPHRTKIRKRVMEIWDDHLDHLQDEMAVTCKAVLSAITNMDFAAPGADDFVPGGAEPRTFLDAIARDPIATVRTSVRVIRASSLRRQYFSEVLKALHMRDLQLLRDVDTRWSSTLIMIDRAVPSSRDLKKYKLSKPEWDALKSFQRILSVPHAFQQRLSAETTPTLGHALPAFEAMISQWEKQQTRHPETADIVQQGINKLDDYRERVEDVPAYILSMRRFSYFFFVLPLLIQFQVVNPAIKLNWFERYRPEKTQSVKNLFLRELGSGFRNQEISGHTLIEVFEDVFGAGKA
ncbi:hypothetical protein R3P38DRAFT_2780753 [Favolaschia claudopus]|uniref:BED-type domain-containing protein n=1 Tax=Favolaschia claudopus TaxID=2862362 RepID=A0AAW0B5W5_9AGAR